MEFRILGPLQVFEEGDEIELGSGRHRLLLGLLLLAPNEAVATDRLVEDLWEGSPPPSAAKSLQNSIVRLRKLLGDRVVTHARGYAIRVDPEELDSVVFERLVESARGLSGGERAEMLRAAVALWRGPVLADVLPNGSELPEPGRLEALRVAALELRIDADLEVGTRAGLVGELEALVADQPYREHLRAQLMLALYREGRQADALALYRDTRRTLVEELGIEPGAELRERERAILAHDPSLEPPAAGVERGFEGRRGRRRAPLAVAAVALAAAAIAAALVATGGGMAVARAPANSVAAIDPHTDRITATVAVGSRPGYLAVGSGSLWVANLEDGTVSRIGLGSGELSRSIAVGAPATGLAAGAGSVWVATADGSVRRIDPAFDTVVQTIRAPDYARYGFQIDPSLEASSPVAVGGGSVWFGHSSTVERIDPQAGEAVGQIGVGLSPSALATGDDAVWVADSVDNTVTRIASSGVTTTIPVGDGPDAVAVGAGGVWVADFLGNSVAEIDPATDAVRTTIPVGVAPTSVTIGDGSVWVANSRSRSVIRIDPRLGRVVATIRFAASPTGLAFGGGRVWVSVERPLAPAQATANETARVNAPADFDSIDPAEGSDSATLQMEYATCAKLLNYPDAPAPAGSQVQPEVASAMPTVTDHGRTYEFRIRSGYRFSPPSNQAVTAATFHYSIERAIRINPDARTMLDDVVGIGAQGRTLTIRLRAPAPDLLARLAYPYFCAVPTDTPPTVQRVQPIPSAGPYYIASYTPKESLVLRRNPNYHGTRPRRLATIAYTFGVSPAHTEAEIQGGRVDYAASSFLSNALPPGDIPSLKARYGPGSPAAKAGHQQYFENPALGEVWLALNSNRGPFTNESLRRAVAYAVNRAALSADTGYAFRPDDHLMPPVLPDYQPIQYYPLSRPDLKKARELMHGRHVVAVDDACNGCSTQLLTEQLGRIGIDVVTRSLPVPQMLRLSKTPGSPIDIFMGGTQGAFGDPSEFLNSVLVGRYIAALAPHDKATLRALAAAARLSGAARERAYGRLDVKLARRATLVPLGYATEQDFFSARMGCRIYQPYYGMDLGALCIKR